MFHDVTNARPAASVVLSDYTRTVTVLDFHRVEPPASIVCGADDGAAHATVKGTVPFEKVVVSGQLFVDVLEKLGSPYIAPTVWKDPRPVVVEKVLKQLIIRGVFADSIWIGELDIRFCLHLRSACFRW